MDRSPPRHRRRPPRRLVVVLAFALALVGHGAGLAQTAAMPAGDSPGVAPAVPLVDEFAREVAPRLDPPLDAAAAYADRLQAALGAAQVRIESPQFVVLVDRSRNVQAALVYWGSTSGGWALVGATPVSTGLPGRYEHFETPAGVFAHSLANPDFRAEGTLNELGIRGYGSKGARVYDFGWIEAPRSWDAGAPGTMRLQMHSTDPDRLEPWLGSARSKGCIRIPARLNEFIDRRGLLDADYEQAIGAGASPWVLRSDRMPTPWSGRWLVVVDSQATGRPGWAVPPRPRPGPTSIRGSGRPTSAAGAAQ